MKETQLKDIKAFAKAAQTMDLPTHLRRIYDWLKTNGIDIEDLENSRINRINFWQSMHKDDKDEAVITDLWGIELSPAWAEGPKWPVVQPGPLFKVPAFEKPKKLEGWQNAVILPDPQMGFYRDRDGNLVPTHDERALSIAMAIIKDVKPSLICNVGDNIDLPEFGKYRLSPAFARTTQASIDRATRFCAELRTAAPDARIIWLEGNHEARLKNYINDNAVAAFGLKAGSAPDSWPALSIPALCHFTEYNIEYESGYPANRFWITPKLSVIHGDKVRQGSTSDVYLRDHKSVIYGHIHRREWSERTSKDYDGIKTIMAASPGCLCRIDGVVPSTKGGVDIEGYPVMSNAENWQQGLAVVKFEPKTGEYRYEQIAIHDGRAIWRDKLYEGNTK